MSSKWEQYSYSELKEMLQSSNSIADWGRKMGYSNSISKKQTALIFKLYPDLEEIAKNIRNNYLSKNNLVGQKFGRLIVKRFAEEVTKEKHNGRKYWECECDCGNIIFQFTSRLKNGTCQSCGCLQKEIAKSNKFIDLTGQQFGRLTVIKQAERPDNVNNTRAYWWCKCSCGNPNLILAQGQMLRKGQKVSCGCLVSQYEAKATRILLENKINYKSQYTFKDLVSDKGRPLRFDFAIFDNNGELSHLIEIQGQQHFKIVPSWGGEEQYNLCQKHDQMKRDFCQQNNIKLLEISYKEDINLKTLGLENF